MALGFDAVAENAVGVDARTVPSNSAMPVSVAVALGPLTATGAVGVVKVTGKKRVGQFSKTIAYAGAPVQPADVETGDLSLHITSTQKLDAVMLTVTIYSV